MTAVKAVLFDLDGTLHDRNATIRRWLEGHLQQFALPGGYAARFLELDDFGYRSKGEVFPQLIQEFGLTHPAEDLLRHYSTALDVAQVMPHALEVLGQLRQMDIRTGIVTNGWHEAQTLCLRNCGLDVLVDAVLISQTAGFSKPDPRLYALALERLQVMASQTWFVGDSPRNDIWGPQQLGIRAAYLPTGHALAGEKPEAILNDLRDVLRLVQ